MSGLWEAITEFFVDNVGITLAVVMLLVFALFGGAYALWRQTGDPTKPVLMVILALVAVVNVLIWTLPDADGAAPIDMIGEAGGD
ncbi:MAG: hypothetical protein AAFQ90_11930 [Pseudomonadota bacterium]